MTSIAILIGNAKYDHGDPLPCCSEDVAAVEALLRATGRFAHVHKLVDLDADAMRNAVRNAVPPDTPHNEVLFYFSGHGSHIGPDLFLCGTSYDGHRPNETGFRHGELMDLFRAARPEGLVIILDACYSGARLVKSTLPTLNIEKGGLRSVIQFSSSMEEQTSFGGLKLSSYTRAFLNAATRKTEGPVYYSDIQNILRDEFIESEEQTPYFVNQGTGRELLTDDASRLASFCAELAQRWPSQPTENDNSGSCNDTSDVPAIVEPPTPRQLLAEAEQKIAGFDEVSSFIDNLFDSVLNIFDESEFRDFFKVETNIHSNFQEPVIRDFMTRILSRETRPDRLVTAEIRRTSSWRNYMERAARGLFPTIDLDDREELILELNCKLPKVQMKLNFIPRYKSLQQLNLVLSCAPSLDRCYIFEMVTQHPRTDWDAFDEKGRDIVRRWYRLSWDSDVTPLVRKIHDALTQAVRDHIDDTTKRLSTEE